MHPAKTRRNAMIRNLHRLGCTQAALAVGFGLSTHRVGQITKRGMLAGANPCPKHRYVLTYCPDCRRVPKEVMA